MSGTDGFLSVADNLLFWFLREVLKLSSLARSLVDMFLMCLVSLPLDLEGLAFKVFFVDLWPFSSPAQISYLGAIVLIFSCRSESSNISLV